MAFPRRTFTADEGQPSTGAAGPDAIEYDLDNAFAMFNPLDTLRTGEPGGIDANENIRNVQVDQNQKPDSDTGKIPALLSGIVNRIKAIMGTPDWKNDPPTTLAGLANQISNVTVNQNATPQGDTGNVQQLLSWIVNRIRAITGRGDWQEDPAVNLQVLAEAATHEDISYHALPKTTHGVQSPYYTAKTSRSDQLPSWNDIPDKPSLFPTAPHQHDARDVVSGVFDPARIPNLPASKITTGQFSVDRIPQLPASKIQGGSGTFDPALLPVASLTQRGIVQLTNSRGSTADNLALAASAMNTHRTSADHDDRYYTKQQVDNAMNAHRTSADHDNRYYTKSQVDNLVVNSGIQWIVPGDTVLAESLSTATTSSTSWSVLKRFVVSRPGRYRITGEFRRVFCCVNDGLEHGVIRDGGLKLATLKTTIVFWQWFSFDIPSRFGLDISDGIELVGRAEGDISCYVHNVRIRGNVGSPPSWVVSE